MKSPAQITASVCESSKWYIVPEYRVMLVRDSNGGVKATGSKKQGIASPKDAVGIFRAYLDGLDREVFCVALLDTKNRVIGINTVSMGTLNSTIIHPREVFKPACIIGASTIMLCHNHPSGDPEPSKDDKKITARLAEAGKILDITVLDHIVIGDNTYYSFREYGLL